jgi:hypothetical protein
MMNQPCSSCRFFRRFTPLSQLLERDLGDDEHVTSALQKMRADERERQDGEFEYRRVLVSRRQAQWPSRPMMCDYCGKQEGDGIFLVAELKNAGRQCRDHDTGVADARPCATCLHRATGGGKERDEREMATLSQLAASQAGLGQGGGTSATENYLKFVGTSKAAEAEKAHYAGKLTNNPPAYLPFCVKFSTRNEFVPCAIQNPFDSCPDWVSPAASSVMSLQDAITLLRRP